MVILNNIWFEEWVALSPLLYFLCFFLAKRVELDLTCSYLSSGPGDLNS